MTNPIFITVNQNKPHYHKFLSNDRIINLTGESGSGKSTFCKQYQNERNCLIIDTDELFSNENSQSVEIMRLREAFRDESKEILIQNFDAFYTKLLTLLPHDERVIVIDSAQFRNIKDVGLLKGDVIVLRTCVDTCYQRCLNRFSQRNPSASTEEKEKYARKKKGMYTWYHSLNSFIKRIDNL